MPEMIPVIDDEGITTGSASRDEIHVKGLKHRGASVVIFNREGKILLQKRSKNKQICPLFWDMSVGEHLRANESYEEAIKRGMKEELGISGIVVKELRGPHAVNIKYPDGLVDNELASLFIGKWNNGINIFDGEVEEAGFFPISEIQRLKEQGKLTPWFLAELDWLIENGIIKF
jgi:isopentenyldiphosphate isomerase